MVEELQSWSLLHLKIQNAYLKLLCVLINHAYYCTHFMQIEVSYVYCNSTWTIPGMCGPTLWSYTQEKSHCCILIKVDVLCGHVHNFHTYMRKKELTWANFESELISVYVGGGRYGKGILWVFNILKIII